MIHQKTPHKPIVEPQVNAHPGEVALLQAEEALNEGDLRRARDLYQEGISCYGPDELQPALARVDLAIVLVELDELDQAWTALELACPVLTEAEHPQLSLARNQMGVLKRREGDLVAARSLHEQARTAAAVCNDLRQQAASIRNLAEIERIEGHLDRAVKLLCESVQLEEAEGESRSVARIWRQIRVLELEAGRLQQAFEGAQRELAQRESLGDPAPIAATLVEAARIARLQGRFGQAEEWLERAARIREEVRDLEGAAKALLLWADLLLEVRRPRAARAKLEAALDQVGESRGPIDIRAELWRALAESDLAILDAFVFEDDPLLQSADESGDGLAGVLDREQLLRRVRAEAEKALDLARQTSLIGLHAAGLRTLARACAHRGERKHAREHFRASVQAVEELEAGLLDLWAHHTFLAYGSWLGRQDHAPTEVATNQRAARDYLERAATLAENATRQGVTSDHAVRARSALALLELRAGNRPAANAQVERALEHLGARVGAGDELGLRAAVELLRRRVSDRTSSDFVSSDVMLQVAGEAATSRTAKVSAEELQQSLFDLHRLQEIAKALNGELDIDRLLDLIIDAAVDLSGAERGFLILTQSPENESPTAELQVAFRVARNIERAEVEHPGRKVSNTIARLAIESDAPVVTADAARDARFAAAGSVVEQRLRSVASVPLRRRKQTIGAIYLDHRYKADLFQPRAVELLESLADHAAIALENARLHQREQERAAQLEGKAERLSSQVESQTVEIKEISDRLAERSREQGKFRFEHVVGSSPAMQRVFRLVDKAAKHDIPVFIHGESGTGKELISQAIHYNSRRATGPIVSENFAAISEELLESELFGHVEGAFTGAVCDKKGLFERANGGTILLDEVGDLSMKMQTELLRVLEEKEVRPLGASDPISVDCRLISATHRDLKAMVAEGTFRQDLFYRLHVFAIEIPPLRDRPEDIPNLANHFLDEYAREYSDRPMTFSAEAMRMLTSFRWPGNVRQLKNFVTRTALLAREEVIQGDEINFGSKGETHDAIEDLSLVPWNDAKNAFARRYLKTVLGRVTGNVSQGARETGMLRQAFQRMLKRHGVDPNEFRHTPHV